MLHMGAMVLFVSMLMIRLAIPVYDPEKPEEPMGWRWIAVMAASVVAVLLFVSLLHAFVQPVGFGPRSEDLMNTALVADLWVGQLVHGFFAGLGLSLVWLLAFRWSKDRKLAGGLMWLVSIVYFVSVAAAAWYRAELTNAL